MAFELKSFFFGIFFTQSHERFLGVKNLVRSSRYLQENNFVKISIPMLLHPCSSGEPMRLQSQNNDDLFGCRNNISNNDILDLFEKNC